MMWIKFVLAAVTVLAATSTTPAEFIAAPVANDLCKQNETACQAFVAGVVDGLEAGYLDGTGQPPPTSEICLPADAKIGEMTDAFKLALGRITLDLGSSAAGVVVAALRERYFCPPVIFMAVPIPK